MVHSGNSAHTHTHTDNTHTHTRLTALFPGLPGWAGTRKVKPIWILLKQETVSGSGISWAVCKSAPCSRQITPPAPHHSVFYRPDALPVAQPTVSKHWRQKHTHTDNIVKKGKGSPYSTAERRVPEPIPVLGSQPAGVINPAVGCHYCPSGLQLPLQALWGLLPISLLGEQTQDGCEQFA